MLSLRLRLTTQIRKVVGIGPQRGSVLSGALSNGLGASSFALKLVLGPRLASLHAPFGLDLGAPANRCLSADSHSTDPALGGSVLQELHWKMLQT